MVRARVTLGASVGDAGAGIRVYGSEHLPAGRRRDVIEAGSVAAFALNIVVARILRGGVPDIGRGDRVAFVAYRVATLTGRRLSRIRLQRRPGIAVRGLLPLTLLGDVTVAARGATGRLVVIAEEVCRGSRRRDEGGTIAIDDLFVHAPADRQHDDHQ